MKSLFGRNIKILTGSKESVLSKSTFSAGLLSLLNTRPFCLIPFQFLSVYLHLNLFIVYRLLREDSQIVFFSRNVLWTFL